MRLALAGIVCAGVVFVTCASTAVAAVTVAPANGRVGETVVLSTVVPTGDNSFDPAYYVDWLSGACPADVRAARTKAVGNTTRGLGVATIEGGGTNTVPVSAKVTLEQPRQRVCFYGGGGALAEQTEAAARTVVPPLDLGEPPENPWSMQASARVRIDGHVHEDPLGWAVLIEFNGRRPLALSHITCDRKRFDLIPSRIKLGGDGSLSYSGSVKADNSRNYDAPIPIPYRGHAGFSFHARPFIGTAPLESPIRSLTGQVSGPSARKLGMWGVPNYRINARFSAPGFHPFAGKPGCGSRLKAIMVAGVNPPVMPGQGEASLGEGGPGGAGQQHTAPNTPPSATFSTDGQYHSISQGTATVHFTSQSVDDDDGIASESWDFGDGTTGSGREVDHTYAAAGDYTVVLTVTDHHGLKDSYSGTAYIDG